MGTVVRKIDQDIDDKIGQQMSTDDLFRLFGMIVPVKKDQSVIATGIEKYSQTHGEYLKKIINEKNANIGYQLAKRVDQEFRKKYPERDELFA
jgi:hypothetical protein